ncbi:DNA/RNA-binding domain E.t1.c1-type [Penicillium odoratum]|uniref:DNA/RNA-binding domain E.t1.c1-type n=1 Tax=Penicillium odoratum TaxID=1167516 RepID=UPI0025479A19|nr:DNA/RNA-binding domain E.t1.c1-type [Penicillium odoratum]KAJ5759888.1 DNA/RNA-binding domain E.t1.c1-type [Penicillium odoratum]
MDHTKFRPRKHTGRSEDLISESMASRMSAVSPPLSSGRPNSSMVDEGTLDTHSSNGARRVKSSRATATRAEKLRRRASPRLSGDSNQILGYHRHVAGMVPQRALDAGVSELQDHMHGGPRPDLPRFYSSPPLGSSNELSGQSMQFRDVSTPSNDIEMSDPALDLTSPIIDRHEYQGMFRQVETNPITQDQLINEVRQIYAGLAMVEKKCIDIDKQQTELKGDLSESQWQALISLHRTLLYEHHDFFLASQHPTASLVLKRLAEKYAMPARMWRYGIHSFLELLRQKLPKSLDYMLNFIYLAYSMITLLLESVSAFRETWIECLGDLARYRMAIEESDMRDREIWAGVSRYWYNLDADRSPDVGRIQHHLAVLARPDGLQQLFYYTKALVCVRPFPNARESIILLFNTYRGHVLTQYTIITTFIATHGVLFSQGTAEQFVAAANLFLSLLRSEFHQLDCQGQQGVYMMSCNFASILQYGEAEGEMALEFAARQGETLAEAHKFALEWTSSSENQSNSNSSPASITSRGSALAFHTLSIFLDQVKKPEIYSSIHTSLAFIWCLSLRPTAMQQLETMIPWLAITKFLNTLLEPETNFSKIEGEAFPIFEETTQQLSEDFLIRGQLWSQLYYPENFFADAPSEDNRPIIEEPTTIIPRRHRCLWLGVRIATFNRWITYSRDRKFAPTQLAHEFATIANTCGHLSVPGPPADHDMNGA